jgi:hypothetical protein
MGDILSICGITLFLLMMVWLKARFRLGMLGSR